jgi:hypothetical protein
MPRIAVAFHVWAANHGQESAQMKQLKGSKLVYYMLLLAHSQFWVLVPDHVGAQRSQ